MSSKRYRFAYKPRHLDDVRDVATLEPTEDLIEIQAVRSLPTDEYDAFVADFSATQGWLVEHVFGGLTSEGRRRVIEVVSPDRPTLYVDPSGHAYARYVAIGE